MPRREPRRARPAPVVVVLHAAADVERIGHVVADVVEQARPEGWRRTSTSWRRRTTRSRRRRCRSSCDRSCSDRSRSRACRRARRATPRSSNVLPPSIVSDIFTPPWNTRSGLFGSMRTWLKYIGRGFVELTLCHVCAAVVGAIEATLAGVRCAAAATAAAATAAPPRPPRHALVVGRRFAATATAATARRSLRFDRRVHDVAVLAIRVETDAAEWAARQSAREARPRVATVDRLPDAAARAAAVHAARACDAAGTSTRRASSDRWTTSRDRSRPSRRRRRARASTSCRRRSSCRRRDRRPGRRSTPSPRRARRRCCSDR